MYINYLINLERKSLFYLLNQKKEKRKSLFIFEIDEGILNGFFFFMCNQLATQGLLLKQVSFIFFLKICYTTHTKKQK
jgi:hypothetical protein